MELRVTVVGFVGGKERIGGFSFFFFFLFVKYRDNVIGARALQHRRSV